MLKKLIGTLALVGLVATGAAQAQEKSRLDEILARGKLIVGVTSEAPPFNCTPALALKPSFPTKRQPVMSERWQPTKSIACPPHPSIRQSRIVSPTRPEHFIPS